MAIRIVQPGGPRARGEGPRLGTVRRPPRGVPRTEYASRNFYDIWLPELAPSEDLVKLALRARDRHAWQTFVKRYRSEMNRPPAHRGHAIHEIPSPGSGSHFGSRPPGLVEGVAR